MNRQNRGEIIIYQSSGEKTALEVKLVEDSVWLNLSELALLFERDKSVISRHINTICKTGELDRDSVVANFATTAADGKTYQVDYYNLDMIISVGYRVNSRIGTQFRIWATNVLREYGEVVGDVNRVGWIKERSDGPTNAEREMVWFWWVCCT